MNINYKILVVGFLSLGVFNSVRAQDVKMCDTYEMTKKLLEANPELRKQYLDDLKKADEADKIAFANGYKEGNGKALLPIYTIPVVFHILHIGGPENISDAQIFDEMTILNNDYAKLNADISAVVPAFTLSAADCEIQFRLAQKDPNGNCTNGIDRIYSTETNIGDDGSKLNPWPRSKYLNVWVVKTITSGAAGYAYTPGSVATGGGAAIDGIIILANYIGSIGTGNVSTSRALTHEVGHYLNLQHTWGPTNQPGCDGTATLTTDPCYSNGPWPPAGPLDNCDYDDGITDTPNTIGWTSCNLSGSSCSSLDNVQNYMDYSYCSNMFTTGQKTRMRDALTNSTASRSSLWTSANLTATGIGTPAVLCLADFDNSTNNDIICSGDSVKFTDLSWNGTPTGWNWTFPGGTPSSSTDSMPVIHYNTSGVYDVSLTVSNTSGSVSATKTSYITVNNSTALYNVAIYSEGFEGTAIPNTDWVVRNQNVGSNAWVQSNSAASTGTKSVRILNSTTSVGHVDELISPPINMTGIAGTSPTLTFKVAYAQRVSTSNDKLSLYVSTDCGKSWQLRKTLTGAGVGASSLVTAGVTSTSFVPSASQWLQKNLVLTTFASQDLLFIMFRFTSDGGNNIYIDDINLSGTSSGIDELENSIDFNIYPNPLEENSFITFSLIEKQKVGLKIFDVLGREVSNLFSGDLNAGEHQYTVSEKLSFGAGIYFIQLNVGLHSFTKKLIVK